MAWTPKELIERIRADRPRISEETLARAIGVDPDVLVAWERGEGAPAGQEFIPRLAWIASQARIWYAQVMHAILGIWRAGPDLDAAMNGPEPPGPGEFFREIRCRRAGRDRVEYEIELAYSFDVLVFIPFGPEQDRVRLARRADGPEEEVVRFTTESWGPEAERADLRAGQTISLFVRLYP